MLRVIRAFHAFSTLLILSAVGFVLFNLMWQYAHTGDIKIVSIKELWTGFDKTSYGASKSFVDTYVPSNYTDFVANAPAAAVLVVLALIFYVPIRIMMFMGIGKKPQYWR